MYAQKLEGDSWRGEKIDSGKIDKMSGNTLLEPPTRSADSLQINNWDSSMNSCSRFGKEIKTEMTNKVHDSAIQKPSSYYMTRTKACHMW